jgi:hypothetical protein
VLHLFKALNNVVLYLLCDNIFTIRFVKSNINYFFSFFISFEIERIMFQFLGLHDPYLGHASVIIGIIDDLF